MLMDPKLTGYLQRALNHEMAAVQQYFTQSALCELWGLDDAAAKFQHESVEELEHAKRLTRHLLTLGIVPNGAQLPAVHPARSLKDMLMADWHLEAEAIRLYSDASQYCARVHEESAYHLFAGLLQEEREHLQDVESWLDDLAVAESQQKGASRV